MLKVPFLPEDRIERETTVLLEQFARESGAPVSAPIPVEDILEGHLHLSLDFDDLHATLGIPLPASGQRDLLGALWIDERSVFIDQSLDPEEHREREGRYRFTLGHEVGHWQLHRQYVPSRAGQANFFSEAPQPTVVCRVSQANEPVEWQANIFSACLLMPREMVLAAYERRFGDRRSRIVRSGDLVRQGWDSVFLRDDPDDVAVRHFVRPFAGGFLVSVEAMRIRLETLGLLRRSESGQPRLVPSS